MDPEKAVCRTMLLFKWGILCRETFNMETRVVGEWESCYYETFLAVCFWNIKKKPERKRKK